MRRGASDLQPSMGRHDRSTAADQHPRHYASSAAGKHTIMRMLSHRLADLQYQVHTMEARLSMLHVFPVEAAPTVRSWF